MSSRSALIVVDLQESQLGRGLGPHSTEQVVSNTNRLISAGRSRGSLIVYVKGTHLSSGGDRLRVIADGRPRISPDSPAGWDSFIDTLLPPDLSCDPIIHKRGWDAFYGTDLDLQLRRHDISELTLCGIATNFGVEGTSRAAIDRGFQVAFAEDAMTSRSAELHRFAVAEIFPQIGRVRSTEQLLTGPED